MPELKECPFCGGKVSFHQDPEECSAGCHLIHCPNCGLFDFSSSADPLNKCETLEALRKDISANWNHRLAGTKDRATIRELSVKLLRAQTDFTMMDCKKALTASDWDLEQAKVYLNTNDMTVGKLVTYARDRT